MKTALILLIIVLLYYLTISNKNTKKVTGVIINDEINQEQVIISKDTSPQKTKKKTAVIQDTIEYSSKSKIQKSDSAYIVLYHKLRLAYSCKHRDIHSTRTIESNLRGFFNSINHNSLRRQDEPTDLQIEYFENYIGQCADLFKEFKEIGELVHIDERIYESRPWSTIIRLIKNNMLDTYPKTDEEKQLKQVIADSESISKTYNKLLISNKGKQLVDNSVIQKLESDIRDLKWKISLYEQKPSF